MPPKKPLPKQEQRARRLEMDRKACDGELVLPHAVCEIRTACGMTQADFGRHFGLTRKQVIELESGKSRDPHESVPTLRLPGRLCKAREIPELFKEKRRYWNLKYANGVEKMTRIF